MSDLFVGNYRPLIQSSYGTVSSAALITSDPVTAASRHWKTLPEESGGEWCLKFLSAVGKVKVRWSFVSFSRLQVLTLQFNMQKQVVEIRGTREFFLSCPALCKLVALEQEWHQNHTDSQHGLSWKAHLKIIKSNSLLEQGDPE